ncbi:carboxymuconolactone decarboxylase family protein [Nocardioides jishulii]|uniref:Carboxymuconolactone decarboxylase family protein n=1 Tax=Nocardioides jishulii TaxID=2575440 RepID=A0A4V5TMU0_9ACTN|nr:carboxymuconolactone decarboxylase family protein [Nocardioides jishulii]QCX28731.1 carboxymuconolactone decarboxylase family protein [Nocardioides jishulii]TKI64373.1 carboxymuconolactone decarboxylase family protein [Nocardioides jishulii]
MRATQRTPRIAPGGWREVGPVVAGLSRVAGRVTGTEPPAIFLTLGRHRGLFWGWLHFAGRLMPGGRLPRRETELVILRVATLTGSDYEFTHHARLGARAGIGPVELERVVAGPSAEGWSRRERLLLEVTDELHRDHDLSDATWSRLRQQLDERTCIELLLLVGHYQMLAQTLGTLRVQPDRDRE